VEEPHAWFAGYAPVDAPQIAVAVVVENSGEGSVYAAPICRQVMEAFFFGPPPVEPVEGE
jgi:cell division protein FtsI/penicillin-binding protein 2